MKKAFKYRIYPTKKQTSKLEETFELCRELHNAAIEERTQAYEFIGKSINYSIQQNQLPEIKKARTEYKQIHSQVLQNVLDRVDKAFQAFFDRVKAGKKPGHPRFTFPQSGFEVITGKIVLSKIDHIKMVLHSVLRMCLSRLGSPYLPMALVSMIEEEQTSMPAIYLLVQASQLLQITTFIRSSVFLAILLNPSPYPLLVLAGTSLCHHLDAHFCDGYIIKSFRLSHCCLRLS